MSSDYIPRLRSELLRAGTTRQPRRRNVRVLRPVLAATAVALIAATIVVLLPGERRDDVPVGTVELSYRVQPAAARQTADVLRARLAAVGIRRAVVTPDGAGITIAVPAGARADVAALTQPGELAIYDWEDSVVGSDRATAPTDPAVTGGADAGHAAATTKAEAQARVEGRPKARVVRAVGAEKGWFALAGAPAITNLQLAGAHAAVDPVTREPIVVLDFTPDGQNAFLELTRALAQRGADNARPGADALAARQHLAIVVDDRILSVPYIDFRISPDGIDGSDGTQILGDLTPQTARRLAAILNAGPLPGPLQP
jgi:preprotein translocase subunit SecD